MAQRKSPCTHDTRQGDSESGFVKRIKELSKVMPEKVLVLGGGWCGVRLAASEEERFIVTNRSEEKVKNSQVTSVLFDMEDDATWGNVLRLRENPDMDISGIVITFALSTSLIEKCKDFLFRFLNGKTLPIVVLSTSSVFRSNGYLDTVTEGHEMNGLGVFGNPLIDRVAAEQQLLDNFDTSVLHLSGLVEDHEEESDNVRSILAMFKKGYMKKPAFPVVNLIHIRDIIYVVKCCLRRDSCSQYSWARERVIVSSGAYRYGDLKRGLDLEPALEETVPIEDENSYKTSKILSIRKLLNLIGVSYEFTLPVPNVQPVSKGLPSIESPHPYESTGPAHDRQFELMKSNFCGKWQGDTSWFKRKDEQTAEEQILTLQQFSDLVSNGSVFDSPPTQVIKGSQYYIYMTDADNGIWHGTGLRFAANGEKKIPISRQLSNSSGKSFQFPGMGSQISSNTSESIFAWEANFFFERERSMIIVMYKLFSPDNDHLELESIGIAPFRCGLKVSKPPAPLRPRTSLSLLLRGIENMEGKHFLRSYQHPLDEAGDVIPVGKLTESVEMCVNSSKYLDRLTQSFDDGIFCSIPLTIQRGGGCKVITGCRPSEKFLQLSTVTYTSDGRVECYHLEKYSSSN